MPTNTTLTIVGTRMSDSLSTAIKQMIIDLRADPQAVASSDIEDVVFRMTKESLEHQFIGTCEQLGLSSPLLKIVHMSVGGSLKATRFGLKKIIPKLTAVQRQALADFFDDAVYEIQSD